MLPTSRTTLTKTMHKGWKRKWSTRRERWFYISPENQTVWDDPKQLCQPALCGWSLRWSKTQAPGCAYYVHNRTGERRWQAPSPIGTTTTTTTTASAHTTYSPSHPALSF